MADKGKGFKDRLKDTVSEEKLEKVADVLEDIESSGVIGKGKEFLRSLGKAMRHGAGKEAKPPDEPPRQD